MFQGLEQICARPRPFEICTARDLWIDEHISEHMLRLHLDQSHDIASRKTDFIDRSIEWIVSRFGVSRDTRVADFGCGPGLYTSRLARKQALVTGIDFSPRSIAYAAQQAETDSLSIRYVNEDYLGYDTEDRFDLILMITCDFCALSPAQRHQMLVKFRRLLNPGGFVLLDVYSLAAFHKRQEAVSLELSEADGFWSPNRYYEISKSFKYGPERVVLDKYTIVEQDCVRTFYNWFQHFDPQAIEREMAAGGLRVAELFANVAGDPFDPAADEFAIVAEKR